MCTTRGGQTAFQLEDVLGFREAAVIEGGAEAALLEAGRGSGRGVRGPGADLEVGRGPTAEAGLGGELLQPGQAGWTHRGDGGGVAGADERGGAVVPAVAEPFGVAGPGGLEDVTDLTVQDGARIDQVAALAAPQLPGDVGLGPGRFEQAETVAGGAAASGPVGVVGLVAGVGGLARRLDGAGMDQAGLAAGLTEGLLHGPVVRARAFEGDDAVLEVVPLHGLADAVAGGLAVAAVVGQGGRFEQDAAREVGEAVARTGLGTVDGDDAEMLGPDGLDARRQLARGFVQDEGCAALLRRVCRGRGMGSSFRAAEASIRNPHGSEGKERALFSQLTPIPRR